MKNNFLRNTGAVVLIAILFTACSEKLDLLPQNDLTPEKVYATPAGYKGVLAKIYGALSIGGNQGPADQPDISGGLDEGSQIAFIRPFSTARNCLLMKRYVSGMTRRLKITTHFLTQVMTRFLKECMRGRFGTLH